MIRFRYFTGGDAYPGVPYGVRICRVYSDSNRAELAEWLTARGLDAAALMRDEAGEIPRAFLWGRNLRHCGRGESLLDFAQGVKRYFGSAGRA